MKKVVFAIALVLVIAAVGFAQGRGGRGNGPNAPATTFDGDFGLYYDNLSLPSGASSSFPSSYDLRGQAMGEFNYHRNARVAFGAELGLGFFPSTITYAGTTKTYELFDVPVALHVLLNAGQVFVEPYGGLLFTESSPQPGWIAAGAGMNYQFGARIGLGRAVRFFGDIAYIIDPTTGTSYERFGVGISTRLDRERVPRN